MAGQAAGRNIGKSLREYVGYIPAKRAGYEVMVMEIFSSSQSHEPQTVAADATSAMSDDERRDGNRHMTVMRVARLVNHSTGVEGLGVVRNISSGGMMVDAGIPTAVGEQIAVSMLDDRPILGEIVWQDAGSIGLKFADKMEVSELLSKPAFDPVGRRIRLPRLAVDGPVEIRTPATRWQVRLCDISQRGAKFSTELRLHRDETVLLTIANCRPVRGTVRWHKDGFAGVEFHRMLGVDELAQWLRVGEAD